VQPELAAKALDRLRAGLGPALDLVLVLATLTRFLVLSSVPTRFRNPGDPPPTTTTFGRRASRKIRPASWRSTASSMPEPSM